MSPLRFLTPGQMGICLVLFFLPWVEVQCPMPDMGNLAKNIGNPKQGPPKLDPKDMTYTPLVTQSGFQAATGRYTIADPMMREMVDQAKKQGGQAGKDDVKSAPVLLLFPVAALAGLVLGLVLPSGSGRKFLLVLCCGLALASAATQAVIGFPITEDVKKNPQAQGGNGKSDDFAGLKPDDVIKTVYKFPFYLAILFALGGVVTAFMEPQRAAKKKPPPYELEDDQPFEVEGSEPAEDDDDRDRPPRRRPPG